MMIICIVLYQLLLALFVVNPALCELITIPTPALTKNHEVRTTTTTTIGGKHLKSIEGSMDLTTDPCENFYQHACGNWDNIHTDTSKYHDQYRMIEYYTNKEVAISLSADVEASKEPKFLRKARLYFKSCVNMKHLDLSQYLKWLEEHENLPVIKSKNTPSSQRKRILTAMEDSRDWLKYLAVLKKYGLSGVLVEETYFNRLKLLKLNRPLQNKGFIKLPFNIFKVLTYTTFGWKNETLKSKWTQFSSLENDLLKLQTLTNGTQRFFNMTSLQEEIPWLKYYVDMLLDNTKVLRVSNLKIFIKDIAYMRGLYKLLQSYDEESITEFLQVRFLWNLLTSVYSQFTPEMCAVKTRQFMFLAMDWLFEKQHPELMKSLPKIHKIFGNIKKHYQKVLLTNPNGFNATIMAFLLKKLNNTQLQIGHLPRLNTEQRLEEMYSDLHIMENNYYHNQMELLKFQTNNTILNYIPTRNRSEYIEHSKKVSPYFHRLYNIVVIPITTLQMPIYDANLDDLFQYSSVGYILGHEITHCFDILGLRRDLNGLTIDIYHDMITSNPKFQENLACIRNLNNGNINEKIADVTGFRVAFQTYFELHPNARHTVTQFSGRNVTLDKLFFLNHAQFRCSSSKAHMFADGTHGTAEDRVVDALSHFPEFVKTFSCSKYTGMHLERTCQLWRK